MNKQYGPNNPPRLRKPDESVEQYRAAMGWPVAAERSHEDVEYWLRHGDPVTANIDVVADACRRAYHTNFVWPAWEDTHEAIKESWRSVARAATRHPEGRK